MTRLLRMLDTDIASYIVKERNPILRPRLLALDPTDVCISSITKSEMLYGLKRLTPDHHLHMKVARFHEGLQILPWDEVVAEIHADIRYRLEIRGRAFGEMDMMIAAHAMAVGAIVVTNNTRHFGRLEPELTIENWVTDS